MPTPFERDMINQGLAAIKDNATSNHLIEDEKLHLIKLIQSGRKSALDFLREYVQSQDPEKVTLAVIVLPHIMGELGKNLKQVYEKLIASEFPVVRVSAAYQINTILNQLNRREGIELLSDFLKLPVFNEIKGQIPKVEFGPMPNFLEFAGKIIADAVPRPRLSERLSKTRIAKVVFESTARAVNAIGQALRLG